ncbi:MAG: hypothetical protein HQL36_08475 [Alphaproteobacteria bacterium]|nr:hypothetical protein [Alphaproteobacteria bacterium]MBF0251699.1 hypothetical protein [Alphaproteobacteria bacterium]
MLGSCLDIKAGGAATKLVLVKVPALKAFATSSVGFVGASAAVLGGNGVIALGALGAAAGAATYGIVHARDKGRAMDQKKAANPFAQMKRILGIS